MGFSEYRRNCLTLLWSKYSQADVLSVPTYNHLRIDDICAEHWKRSSLVIINCVLELENYIMNDLLVERI